MIDLDRVEYTTRELTVQELIWATEMAANNLSSTVKFIEARTSLEMPEILAMGTTDLNAVCERLSKAINDVVTLSKIAYQL